MFCTFLSNVNQTRQNYKLEELCDLNIPVDSEKN